MANHLAPVNTKQLVGQFDEQELITIKNNYAPNATNEEFALFIQICKHNGLSPFKNHVYFIKYGNQMSIQVSVEGIQYLAQQREDFKGVTTQLVHENDEFEVGVDPESQELKIEKHSIKIPRGKVAAAYAIARREGYPDKVVIIETEEVEHLKNKSGSQWKAYYNDMLKKYTLKRALKLQFGIDVDDQEQQQEASYEPTRQRVDITPNEDDNTIEVGEGEVIDPKEKLDEMWDDINKKFEKYGKKKADLTKLIKEQFNKKPADMNLSEVAGLSKLIDFEWNGPSQDDIAAADDFFDNVELDLD